MSSGLCAHALHGRAGRWLINEKGAVASAGRLHLAPEGFADRAHGLLACLGTSPDHMKSVLAEAAALVAQTSAACERAR